MNYPIGNGYFIWLLPRCAPDGDYSAMAKKAKEAGLSWVAIKIADGPYTFNVVDGHDHALQATKAFTAEGISVWGWHYIYGYMPAQEAKMGAKRTRDLSVHGMKGYIINAESEYKGKPVQAAQFMSTLKAELKMPIGICTYRYPSYHPTFPWKEFLRVDFNMPQVYWMGAQNSAAQLRRSLNEFAQRTSIPFIPLGAAFSEHGWSPTTYSIKDFVNAVKELSLGGYGWWEWYPAARNDDWWRASTGTASTTPAVIKVYTPYSYLRYRSDPSLSGLILGYVPQNKHFTVVHTEGDWLYLEELKGWCHKAYTVRVS